MADPRPIRVIDYLRSPADDAASDWRSAAGDIPSLPLLCSLSGDGATLIALDGVTGLGNGTYRYFLPPPDLIYVDDLKIHRIPLPDRLRGCELTCSSGHFLILQDPPPLSAIHLFSPFSSPAQFASLPPPPAGHTFPAGITFDTDGRIALAILSGSSSRRLAYVSLDSNSPWIDLTDRMPLHPQSRLPVSFEYPFLHTGGLFYGVDDTGTRVYALDFSTAPGVKFTDVTFDLPNNHSFPVGGDRGLGWCCHQSASLVLSGPYLFLVRWRKAFTHDGVCRAMEVFVLDGSREKWFPQESLGDCSFFIGRNLSISMPATDSPEDSPEDPPELKPNRVYLCLDADTHISGSNAKLCCYTYYGFRHHLFHDLEDGTWRHFHDDVSLIMHRFACPSPFSVWMLPPQGASRRTNN